MTASARAAGITTIPSPSPSSRSPGSTRMPPSETGPADFLHPDAVLAGPHPVAAAEDRVAELDAAIDVAADSVDDRPGDAAARRHGRQQITPDGRVAASLIVEHDDLPRTEVVDVVADAARVLADRSVPERPRTTDEPERAIESHDPLALAENPALVESVAHPRRGERRELRELLVSHGRAGSRSRRPSPRRSAPPA